MEKFVEYKVRGVRVEAVMPDRPQDGRPPILFVHGGCHGSWSWEKFMPYFAAAGWECHALNWYGHNGSDAPQSVPMHKRSIDDVQEEIGHVARQFAVPPVLIGHSMGGLASQTYAERNPVAALVLTASAVPEQVGGIPLDYPVDTEQPWGPPPFEDTQKMFFQGLTEAEAEHYHALLCAESPQAVIAATRYTIPVDRIRISGPVLVLAAELDFLTPPATGRALADYYGADYLFIGDRGHNLLLEPRWEETARLIQHWLSQVVP